jgi:haloacetate dehalogenase
VTALAERTVEAGGIRFFVREAGEGDPILLLHGFPQTGDCWHAVAGKLAERHRVIVPDLPGFGRSDPPPRYDSASVAGLLASFCDAVDARGQRSSDTTGVDRLRSRWRWHTRERSNASS